MSRTEGWGSLKEVNVKIVCEFGSSWSKVCFCINFELEGLEIIFNKVKWIAIVILYLGHICQKIELINLN
jgi:hypothetical protein